MCSGDAVERPDLDLALAGPGRAGGEREVLLRLHEGAVGEHRLAAPVVGDGGVLGSGEPAAEHPAPLSLELLVERVDGPGRGVVDLIGRVSDDGEEVVHVGHLQRLWATPAGRPLTTTTIGTTPIRHRTRARFHRRSR